jgi:hypothetical protein
MSDFENGLTKRINERIQARGFCVVYDHDLACICAPEEALRRKQIQVIEKFATKHGLDVRIRDIGINATFTKRAARQAQKTVLLKNGSGSEKHVQLTRRVTMADGKREMERYCEARPNSPTAVRRPLLRLRCGTWIALLGRSLDEGIVGLGSTVLEALREFDLQYLATEKLMNLLKGHVHAGAELLG